MPVLTSWTVFWVTSSKTMKLANLLKLAEKFPIKQ